jgi:hypothetical protein
MNTVRFTATGLFLYGCLLSLQAQTLSARDDTAHIGENKTVCGEIASEYTATSSHGTPTFINVDQPYPHQVFTILIWGDDGQKVGQFPTSGRVCATGMITEYHGSPEIVLRDSHSWNVPK